MRTQKLQTIRSHYLQRQTVSGLRCRRHPQPTTARATGKLGPARPDRSALVCGAARGNSDL